MLPINWKQDVCDRLSKKYPTTLWPSLVERIDTVLDVVEQVLKENMTSSVPVNLIDLSPSPAPTAAFIRETTPERRISNVIEATFSPTRKERKGKKAHPMNIWLNCAARNPRIAETSSTVPTVATGSNLPARFRNSQQLLILTDKYNEVVGILDGMPPLKGKTRLVEIGLPTDDDSCIDTVKEQLQKMNLGHFPVYSLGETHFGVVQALEIISAKGHYKMRQSKWCLEQGLENPLANRPVCDSTISNQKKRKPEEPSIEQLELMLSYAKRKKELPDPKVFPASNVVTRAADKPAMNLELALQYLEENGIEPPVKPLTRKQREDLELERSQALEKEKETEKEKEKENITLEEPDLQILNPDEESQSVNNVDKEKKSDDLFLYVSDSDKGE